MEVSEKRTSGAKDRVDFIAAKSGINPGHTVPDEFFRNLFSQGRRR
jgi:hypothetical protein